MPAKLVRRVNVVELELIAVDEANAIIAADASALVQTNLDNTPKQWGTPVLLATRSNTGSNFTQSGGPFADDRLIMARYRAESDSANHHCRFEGRVSGNTVVEAFFTSHGGAQYAAGAGVGVTFMLRAGQTWQVVRTNVSGSQNVTGNVWSSAFTP